MFTISLTPFLVAVLGHAAASTANGAYGPLPSESLLAPVPVLEGWAQYAPQYPVGKYLRPPGVCDITQVREHLNFLIIIDYVLGQHCESKE